MRALLGRAMSWIPGHCESPKGTGPETPVPWILIAVKLAGRFLLQRLRMRDSGILPLILGLFTICSDVTPSPSLVGSAPETFVSWI